MRARLPFILFLATLFSACAVSVPRPPDGALEQLWRAHEGRLHALSQWELRGRLAVHTDSRGGQASLVWQRSGAHHSIRLNGPLGSGMVRVVQDADGARLTDAEQRSFEAGSAEELLWRYTGWQLPVSSLDWWVRGLPVPQQDVERELDDAGHLRVLRQDDWQVRYESYVTVGALELPGRITLHRAATGSYPDVEVRFVIDRWLQVQ